MFKTKQPTTKVICTCSSHTCLHLYCLHLKLTVLCGLSGNFIPANIQNIRILKGIDQTNETSTKKAPYRLVSFLVKLLNGSFSSRFRKNFITQCFILLSFFFFISNITIICKNRIPPSSESEMISKKLVHHSFTS